MRKHLFKARRVDNMEWIEGSHLFHKGNHYIFPWSGGLEHGFDERYSDRPDCVEVDPKTLSEYTGLKDSNGKRIFENDAVENAGDRYIVEWTQDNARFSLFDVQDDVVCDFDNFYGHELEVIGSIFDSYSEGSV